jgi:uncharacterized protein YaiL (DUF2058 family)
MHAVEREKKKKIESDREINECVNNLGKSERRGQRGCG